MQHRKLRVTCDLRGVPIATRRQFVDVASGVAASFCSRNNDFQGAWLPGVLLRAQTSPDTADIVVDLIMGCDDNAVAANVGERYGNLLRSITARVGLSATMMTSAQLRVQYAPRAPNWTREEWTNPREELDRPTWSFVVTVSITDDRAHVHEATCANWCWPELRALPVSGSLYGPDGRTRHPHR
ncbi:hypothetical protein GCM10009819_12750 [Agromyces tropicus]|uniref:Uncharacterized protein n=1 Tax=Agromyces tropicus TaxID=555371 RepID=A0ABN2UDN6_9MICO